MGLSPLAAHRHDLRPPRRLHRLNRFVYHPYGVGPALDRGRAVVCPPNFAGPIGCPGRVPAGSQRPGSLLRTRARGLHGSLRLHALRLQLLRAPVRGLHQRRCRVAVGDVLRRNRPCRLRRHHVLLPRRHHLLPRDDRGRYNRDRVFRWRKVRRREP